ncbi:MAG: hypothetical protein ABGX16_12760 [Pirellulales bacterium]
MWRVDYGEGFSVVPRPVYAHGRLYVATGFMRPQLLAINPHGATGDATKSNIVWQHNLGVPNTSSTLVVGDEIYCLLLGSKNPRLQAITSVELGYGSVLRYRAKRA